MTIGPMSVLSITGRPASEPPAFRFADAGFKAFFQRVSHCVISL